ncbi:hypothetical protein B0I31_1214 [Saccharothrix carnea]|uniref:Uncharacterized protein n=1 Tax=Saccharothrix carnea TaxID=1280637 RepID=A0A2P8HYW5_SACCR|nr:hypothetical protein [Saccharothrix carnea]PSL51375.1 hypothetical protein B0I31_1214 [Saccharothrix carnea]
MLVDHDSDLRGHTWAMLVLDMDILDQIDPDTAAQVALFAGIWLADQPPAELHDGDLVIRPLPPGQEHRMHGDNHVADG